MMTYRPDNMHRPRPGTLLDGVAFTRTDGKIIGPAACPIIPDRIIFHGPEHATRKPQPPGHGNHGRVSAAEIADSLAGEAHTQYDEPA
jgi:hypothetical protein